MIQNTYSKAGKAELLRIASGDFEDIKSDGDLWDLIRNRDWNSREQTKILAILSQGFKGGSGTLFDIIDDIASVSVIVNALDNMELSKREIEHVRYYLYPILLEKAETDEEIDLLKKFESRFGIR